MSKTALETELDSALQKAIADLPAAPAPAPQDAADLAALSAGVDDAESDGEAEATEEIVRWRPGEGPEPAQFRMLRCDSDGSLFWFDETFAMRADMREVVVSRGPGGQLHTVPSMKE